MPIFAPICYDKNNLLGDVLLYTEENTKVHNMEEEICNAHFDKMLFLYLLISVFLFVLSSVFFVR